MTAHSLLGASGAYRWLACPGSFALSQTQPHRRPSIYAATGSLAHEFIETAVKAGQPQINGDQLGRSWPMDDGHTITVDQDFIDGVNVMLDYLNRCPGDWMKVEFRVDLDSYFPALPPVPMFGTVDAGILGLADRTLEIIDYKNGSGVIVNPVENPQLLFYAAGVLAQLPEPGRRQVERLKLTIVQPHAPGLNPIRSWEISVVDLLIWVDDILVPGVEACAQPDAPLNPGSWCRFCPVAGHCPKLHQDAVALAKLEFDDGVVVEMPEEPDDLAEALAIAERAELWIARIREHAIDKLQDQDGSIPGWGLVPTRPTRKWIYDDAGTASLLQTQRGCTYDELFEIKLRSPAQLEKLLARRGDRVPLTQLVEAKSSGVKLARTGPTAAEEFADDQ